MRLRPNTLTRLIFAFVLVHLPITPLAASDLSPELPVASRVLGPAQQQLWAIASDGSGFLMVWRHVTTNDILAARITESGRVLDPLGILISESGEPSGLVWSGTHYVLLLKQTATLEVVTVTPGGAVSSPRTVFSSTEGEGIISDFIVAGENEILVVWGINGGSRRGETHFAALNKSGELLAASRILDQRPNVIYRSAIAANSGFVLLGRGPETNHMLHLQPFVQLLDSAGRLGARRALPEVEAESLNSLGRVSEGYLIVWKTGFNSGEGELRATLVSEDFSQSASFPLAVGAMTTPDLVIAGDQPFIFFGDQNSLLAGRLDVKTRSLSPLTTVVGAGSEKARRRAVSRSQLSANVVTIASDGQNPVISFDGQAFVVAWARFNPVTPLYLSRRDVLAARFLTAGEAGPEQTIAASTKDERSPVVTRLDGSVAIVYVSREDVVLRFAR